MIVATLVLALQPFGWRFFYWLVNHRKFSGIALSKCCLRNIPLQMVYVSFKFFILFLYD